MGQAVVGIIMGSDSDWNVMKNAAKILKEFDVPFEAKVMSAHRTPELTQEYVSTARERGLACIIAGAGGAAHLAGVAASHTTLPILGVPITSQLNGLDSLLSTVQMPKGIPVATFAIGEAGAANAALFAVSLLAINNPEMAEKLNGFRKKQAEIVSAKTLPTDF